MSGLSVAIANTTAFAAAFQQSVVAIVSPSAQVILKTLYPNPT